MIEISLILESYIDGMKELADANRDSLGFFPRKKFEEIREQRRAFVALQDDHVIGFVIFRHRKLDLQTTLSEICVQSDYRNQQIGRRLIEALIRDCEHRYREFIQLKCPIDLPANKFYERLGFKLHSVEEGKKRKLKVWRLIVSTAISE